MHMRKTFMVLASTSLALGLAACDVDQTEEGAAPDIDINAGELPEFDVETADVNVTTGTRTVEIPTADVDVNVPDADGEPVTAPSE